MDKQKQIEEMYDDISERLVGVLDCEIMSVAIHLHGLGYRKIPKGAVVYTKERVDKIFNDYAEYIKKVRKETAERFAEMVSKAFFGLSCIDIDEWNWCQNKIDEICKELEGE